MQRELVISFLTIGTTLAISVDLTKVKECSGYLDFRPIFDKREDDLQFYMQTTAKSEQDCIHMCYEKLHFCYTVMYKPRHDDPSAEGICYFGYYRPDSCDSSAGSGNGPQEVQANSQAESGAKVNGNAKIFTCISCKESPPSFVQDLDENRLGPAQLIKPVDHASTRAPQDNSNQTNPFSGPTHVLYLRESKAFSYLMPKCAGKLSFGIQATLMNRRPKIYAATNETTSVSECAHFCFRQHFCASAFFHNDNCLLSYETSECSDVGSLPVGYTGSVLISCIECQKTT